MNPMYDAGLRNGELIGLLIGTVFGYVAGVVTILWISKPWRKRS